MGFFSADPIVGSNIAYPLDFWTFLFNKQSFGIEAFDYTSQRIVPFRRLIVPRRMARAKKSSSISNSATSSSSPTLRRLSTRSHDKYLYKSDTATDDCDGQRCFILYVGNKSWLHRSKTTLHNVSTRSLSWPFTSSSHPTWWKPTDKRRNVSRTL